MYAAESVHFEATRVRGNGDNTRLVSDRHDVATTSDGLAIISGNCSGASLTAADSVAIVAPHGPVGFMSSDDSSVSGSSGISMTAGRNAVFTAVSTVAVNSSTGRARRDRTRVVLRSFCDDADPRAFARSSEAQRKSSRVNSAFRFFRSFAHGAAVRKQCPEIENQHPADCAQLQWRWTSWLCFSRGWVRDARRKPHNTARVDFRRRRDPRRIATPLAFR